MELYKESLLNKIEDDLTGRNQNWDAIETHLADYDAHVAESAQKHITESGENTNGSYVRFDDGTQICWKTSLTISYIDNVEYIEGTWYYPASFISPPTTPAPLLIEWGTIADYYGKISTFYAMPISTSYIRYILYKTGDAPIFTSSHNCKITVMAIGRWK